MKNEFGVKIGRNGYAPSIFDIRNTEGVQCCLLCEAVGPLERHEVFGGSNPPTLQGVGPLGTIVPSLP